MTEFKRDIPFVIYQEKNLRDNTFKTKFQPMEINPSIGKFFDMYSFLMKTHERVNGGERYIYRDEIEYIYQLVLLKAIVYDDIRNIHMLNENNINNVEFFIDMIKNQDINLFVNIYQKDENGVFISEPITEINGTMDRTVLRKILIPNEK